MAKVISLEAVRKELRKMCDSTQSAIHIILDTESVYQEQLLDPDLTWFELGKRRKQGYQTARELMDEVEIALRDELVLIPQYRIYALGMLENFSTGVALADDLTLQCLPATNRGDFDCFEVDDIVHLSGMYTNTNNNVYTVVDPDGIIPGFYMQLDTVGTTPGMTADASNPSLRIVLLERAWTPQTASLDPRVVYPGDALVAKLESVIDTLQDMDSELSKIEQDVRDAFIAGDGWDYINGRYEAGYDKLEDLRQLITAILEQTAVREQVKLDVSREVDSITHNANPTNTLVFTFNVTPGNAEDAITELFEVNDAIKVAGNVPTDLNLGVIISAITADTLTVNYVATDSEDSLLTEITLLEET